MMRDAMDTARAVRRLSPSSARPKESLAHSMELKIIAAFIVVTPCLLTLDTQFHIRGMVPKMWVKVNRQGRGI